MLIQTTSVKLSETYTQKDQSCKRGSLGIEGDKRIVSGLCIAKILDGAGLANTASLLLSSILVSSIRYICVGKFACFYLESVVFLPFLTCLSECQT